jgi:LuxR family transcriptional regulator, maltose regulon positive regulatory protein
MTHLPETKLRPPRSASPPVPRPRLDALLGAARRDARVTIVAAPAGYGKTTLVATWASGLAPASAWFCLDPGDDPGDGSEADADARVATWLGAALVAAQALSAAPKARGLLALAAALEETPWRGVVVLDDAHSLGPASAAAVATWVERAPEGVHTLLVGRHAPSVPVARWLARGEAELVQAEALRMTRDEARALLAITAPDLPAKLADALATRVEGWPAGLHLASRSLRGRADPEDVIARFTGTDRYVLAFLTEEVLLRLPDDLHEATLLLAGEPRVCAGLVNALTERSDGAALLARLEAHEAFLERVGDVQDADAPWFRFPGFFRDLLSHRLALARPDLPPTLRARAARWWQTRARAGDERALPPTPPGSAEPLTQRERDVLRAIVAGATTKAAARALGVSPNTVKTHTRHLFEKLGVRTRSEAAARARELGLDDSA